MPTVSLAAFRYRNILAENGGPIAAIIVGEVSVRGRRMFQANARLKPGLTPPSRTALFSSDHGTGTHASVSVARHMAVSEALERWCFHKVVRSERAALYGFDIDSSTNGMAAFPGLLARDARRRAMLEAVERYCLIAWWEGMIAAEPHETDWPGVSAAAISGPFGGVTAIVWIKTQCGAYAYGYAADETFTAACERALTELARNESILKAWWFSVVSGEPKMGGHIFERRCLYFSSEEGHELFQEKLTTKSFLPQPECSVICDSEIPGPWSEYSTVWRYALRPPSTAFLTNDERCFFW